MCWPLCQCKGNKNFADITISKTNTEHSYFASEHGKGEGDGEIGVINKNIDKAILHRHVNINSVQDLFTYCLLLGFCLKTQVCIFQKVNFQKYAWNSLSPPYPEAI